MFYFYLGPTPSCRRGAVVGAAALGVLKSGGVEVTRGLVETGGAPVAAGTVGPAVYMEVLRCREPPPRPRLRPRLRSG